MPRFHPPYELVFASMKEAWLASQLEAGRSIEAIARETGLAPSTVAYWVNKHGLASQHAPRHRPRGGLTREQLEPLVEQGRSIREIAEQFGVSYTTVRYWLGRHELATARAVRLATTSAARANGAATTTATCPRHGLTTFGRSASGRYRCLRCRSEAVSDRRRRVKQRLVEAAGGRCVLCGYDRTPAALQFHHVEPAEKAFSIADRGVARAIDKALAEAQKCVLLCATCHAEVEAGVATLPAIAAD
jgi:transposase-like protein